MSNSIESGNTNSKAERSPQFPNISKIQGTLLTLATGAILALPWSGQVLAAQNTQPNPNLQNNSAEVAQRPDLFLNQQQQEREVVDKLNTEINNLKRIFPRLEQITVSSDKTTLIMISHGEIIGKVDARKYSAIINAFNSGLFQIGDITIEEAAF